MKVYNGLVSIVVPFAGSLQLLKQCVENIKSTVTECELIIVADRCNEDALTYLLSLYNTGARIMINPELMGVTTALNLGFDMARGRYIAILETDVRVQEGWLETMTNALEQNPNFGWVALSSEYTGFLTAVSVMTSVAFREAGPWDERFSQGEGFMDDVMMRRLWSKGFTPHIVEGARASHDGRGTLAITIGEIRPGELTVEFLRNQSLFHSLYQEWGTNWDELPRYNPAAPRRG